MRLTLQQRQALGLPDKSGGERPGSAIGPAEAVAPARRYTTREVAKVAGVSRQTLQAWIAGGKVKAPAVIEAAGGSLVRLWTDADLAEVLKVKPRKYPRRAKVPKRKR